ncbi:hypothetical protein [Pseudoclavibacter sp. 13-3]|uniref:hypothetical protein n=1 Tax=Pseudoclavibacter sp. 13-3 TaxID=2901228 RepID=UPI001E41938B|nr:hypothetical protein [Pseudoclavibacter sp. 13-3]MCD7100444.1 hypothetical protein [Pseudoclavibacter sp. 13-3]
MQRKADTALTAAGTQVAQAVRKLTALVQQVLDLIARMPQVQVRKDVKTNFGLSSSAWSTVVSVTLPKIDDLPAVAISASAQANVEGLTTTYEPNLNGRILINGVPSTSMVAAYGDGGAGSQTLVLQVADVAEISPQVGPVTVALQMNTTVPGAFPASEINRAVLTIYAGYSRV